MLIGILVKGSVESGVRSAECGIILNVVDFDSLLNPTSQILIMLYVITLNQTKGGKND